MLPSNLARCCASSNSQSGRSSPKQAKTRGSEKSYKSDTASPLRIPKSEDVRKSAGPYQRQPSATRRAPAGRGGNARAAAHGRALRCVRRPSSSLDAEYAAAEASPPPPLPVLRLPAHNRRARLSDRPRGSSGSRLRMVQPAAFRIFGDCLIWSGGLLKRRIRGFLGQIS